MSSSSTSDEARRVLEAVAVDTVHTLPPSEDPPSSSTPTPTTSTSGLDDTLTQRAVRFLHARLLVSAFLRWRDTAQSRALAWRRRLVALAHFRRTLSARTVRQWRVWAVRTRRQRARDAADTHWKTAVLRRSFAAMCRRTEWQQRSRQAAALLRLVFHRMLLSRVTAGWRAFTLLRAARRHVHAIADAHHRQYVCVGAIRRWRASAALGRRVTDFAYAVAARRRVTLLRIGLDGLGGWARTQRRLHAAFTAVEDRTQRGLLQRAWVVFRDGCREQRRFVMVTAALLRRRRQLTLQFGFRVWGRWCSVRRQRRRYGYAAAALELARSSRVQATVFRAMVAWYRQQRLRRAAVRQAVTWHRRRLFRRAFTDGLLRWCRYKQWRATVSQQISGSCRRRMLSAAWQALRAWPAVCRWKTARRMAAADLCRRRLLTGVWAVWKPATQRRRRVRRFVLARHLAMVGSAFRQWGAWERRQRLLRRVVVGWQRMVGTTRRQVESLIRALHHWAATVCRRALAAWQVYIQNKRARKARYAEALAWRQSQLERAGLELMLGDAPVPPSASAAAVRHAVEMEMEMVGRATAAAPASAAPGVEPQRGGNSELGVPVVALALGGSGGGGSSGGRSSTSPLLLFSSGSVRKQTSCPPSAPPVPPSPPPPPPPSSPPSPPPLLSSSSSSSSSSSAPSAPLPPPSSPPPPPPPPPSPPPPPPPPVTAATPLPAPPPPPPPFAPSHLTVVVNVGDPTRSATPHQHVSLLPPTLPPPTPPSPPVSTLALSPPPAPPTSDAGVQCSPPHHPPPESIMASSVGSASSTPSHEQQAADAADREAAARRSAAVLSLLQELDALRSTVLSSTGPPSLPRPQTTPLSRPTTARASADRTAAGLELLRKVQELKAELRLAGSTDSVNTLSVSGSDSEGDSGSDSFDGSSCCSCSSCMSSQSSDSGESGFVPTFSESQPSCSSKSPRWLDRGWGAARRQSHPSLIPAHRGYE